MAVMSFKSIDGYTLEVIMNDEKAKEGRWAPVAALSGATLKLNDPLGNTIAEAAPNSGNQKGEKPSLKHRVFMLYADIFFSDPWKNRIYIPEWNEINQTHPLLVLEKLAGEMFAWSPYYQLLDKERNLFTYWKSASREISGVPHPMKIEQSFDHHNFSICTKLHLEYRFSKSQNRDYGKPEVSGETSLTLKKYQLGTRYVHGDTMQRPSVPWFDHMIADNREVIERFYGGFVDVDGIRHLKK